MPRKYDAMTTDDFDRILRELMVDEYADRGSPVHMLTIPGIYEILAKHFNNDVLDRWTQEQTPDGPDDEQPDTDKD